MDGARLHGHVGAHAGTRRLPAPLAPLCTSRAIRIRESRRRSENAGQLLDGEAAEQVVLFWRQVGPRPEVLGLLVLVSDAVFGRADRPEQREVLLDGLPARGPRAETLLKSAVHEEREGAHEDVTVDPLLSMMEDRPKAEERLERSHAPLDARLVLVAKRDLPWIEFGEVALKDPLPVVASVLLDRLAVDDEPVVADLEVASVGLRPQLHGGLRGRVQPCADLLFELSDDLRAAVRVAHCRLLVAADHVALLPDPDLLHVEAVLDLVVAAGALEDVLRDDPLSAELGGDDVAVVVAVLGFEELDHLLAAHAAVADDDDLAKAEAVVEFAERCLERLGVVGRAREDVRHDGPAVRRRYDSHEDMALPSPRALPAGDLGEARRPLAVEVRERGVVEVHPRACETATLQVSMEIDLDLALDVVEPQERVVELLVSEQRRVGEVCSLIEPCLRRQLALRLDEPARDHGEGSSFEIELEPPVVPVATEEASETEVAPDLIEHEEVTEVAITPRAKARVGVPEIGGSRRPRHWNHGPVPRERHHEAIDRCGIQVLAVAEGAHDALLHLLADALVLDDLHVRLTRLAHRDDLLADEHWHHPLVGDSRASSAQDKVPNETLPRLFMRRLAPRRVGCLLARPRKPGARRRNLQREPRRSGLTGRGCGSGIAFVRSRGCLRRSTPRLRGGAAHASALLSGVSPSLSERTRRSAPRIPCSRRRSPTSRSGSPSWRHGSRRTRRTRTGRRRPTLLERSDRRSGNPDISRIGTTRWP